jgi:hypothetical protein
VPSLPVEEEFIQESWVFDAPATAEEPTVKPGIN